MNNTNINNSEFIELLVPETDVSLVSANLVDKILLDPNELINNRFIYSKNGSFYIVYADNENSSNCKQWIISKKAYRTLSEAFEAFDITLTKEIINSLNEQIRRKYINKSIWDFNYDIRFNTYLINETILGMLTILEDISYLYKADLKNLSGKFICKMDKTFYVIDNSPGSKYSIENFESYELALFFLKHDIDPLELSLFYERLINEYKGG